MNRLRSPARALVTVLAFGVLVVPLAGTALASNHVSGSAAATPSLAAPAQHRVQALTPRPTALGTTNQPTYNFSPSSCGTIGVWRAGFTGLGYQYTLAPGRNDMIAGFYSGGPRVQVQQYTGVGWRTVGVFGIGQHPFGEGRFILTRLGC